MSGGAPDFSAELRQALGADALLTSAAECAPFLNDHRRLYHGAALAVALPRTVAEVSRVLALCHARRVAVVPHGGNTSYCGGATPDESGRQLVLSLQRLNRIRSVDAANYSLIAEAGCVLAQVQRAADEAERFFPLSLGSEGSCQIGGNLSTNAGGLSVAALRHDARAGAGARGGAARRARPAGAVGAAQGQHRLRRARRCSWAPKAPSESSPRRASSCSPRCARVPRRSPPCPTCAAAVELLGRLREASSDRVSSFELIPRIAVELTTRHIPGVTDPLARAYPWYVLCELGFDPRGRAAR